MSEPLFCHSLRLASIRMLEGEDGRKRFELPGSRAHYAPSLLFTISHMRLAIEPDLQELTIGLNSVVSTTSWQSSLAGFSKRAAGSSSISHILSGRARDSTLSCLTGSIQASSLKHGHRERVPRQSTGFPASTIHRSSLQAKFQSRSQLA